MNILVLSGGASAERDVSLESGRCVCDALRQRGHHTELLDPRDNSVADIDVSDWDVAVPMVHGTGGEDGVLQQHLTRAGLPYVGSSAEASELTFNKWRTNTLLKQRGITVPDHLVVRASNDFGEIEKRIRRFAGQVVTKPPQQGSSVGVSIVTDPADLQRALNTAFEFDEVCLVEKYIAGREVTVPVIDGTAFPTIEIRPKRDWYDYSAKYIDEETQYVIAPEDVSDSVAETAVSACQICGVTGIARVDFIVDSHGSAWLLEVNTIPGMTSHSLVPKSAAAAGLSLGELCEMAIENCLSHK